MDWSEIITELSKVIIPILGTALTFLVGYIIQQVKDKTKNEKVEKYLDMLYNAVRDVVNDLSQTVVAELKEKASDGKLTQDEVLAIGQTAVNRIKMQIPVYAKDFLDSIYNDLDGIIVSMIESYLFERKEMINK